MAWNIDTITEHRDLDVNNKFVRYKRANFFVNGTKHTLRISMPDFNAGKTEVLVAAEAQLILDALGKSKK